MEGSLQIYMQLNKSMTSIESQKYQVQVYSEILCGPIRKKFKIGAWAVVE
jgi:hypothetical protein